MFAAVLMAVAACLTITALANGRKPVASVAVKAVVETSAGTNEIFNVRLASGTNELMERCPLVESLLSNRHADPR